MEKTNKFIWFDFFRGVAALMVLISHLRALIFTDFEPTSSIFKKLFYFITGFGHQAVIIFFVLSGFFIIRSIERSVKADRWSYKEYGINRMTRLWIVLIPSLFMSLLLDNIGLFYFQHAYTYSGQISSLPNMNPTGQLGISVFLGNLFFTQKILTTTYGTNGPLWSLAYEFWYYVLFPLAYFTLIKYYNLKVKIVSAILFLLVLFFIGKAIAVYFIVWLFGGVAYLVVEKEIFLKKFITIKVAIVTIVFLAFLSSIRFAIYPVLFNDFSLGIVTACLLCVFAQVEMKSSLLVRITNFFSEISYTLYLTHFSFAILLVTIFQKQRIEFSYANFGIYVIYLLVILLYSSSLWFLFERNTNKIKKWVKSKV
ncbi:acyltransferase family protein [Bernardetia sp.]|uniref:acyltransferase family protein n=1 Tax=Bernardetia sp. TaxID=1937974 RepID=UPI0025B875EB|nr:acyltransferase [Bernardetia sp.]